MKVDLLNITPISVAVIATKTCYDNVINIDDTITDKDKELLYKVALQNKHESVIEHIYASFYIDGISRAVLQELARHRIASFSVKSTRFTITKDLKKEKPFISDTAVEKYIKFTLPESKKDVWLDFRRANKYIMFSDDIVFNYQLLQNLEYIRSIIASHPSFPKDILKYALQECYKTTLVFSINIRSLRNLVKLRIDKRALEEFQYLAKELYNALPIEYKQLFTDIIDERSIEM